MKIRSPIYLVILTLTIFSCKKEKNNPVMFDCIQKLQIKDFEIFERVADTILPTNAALTSSAVIFKASEKYDSVKWQIGKDVRTNVIIGRYSS